jgi:AAA+ ATPase superfamily predicted ATPase
MNQVGKPVYGNNLIGRDNEVRLIKELILAGQSIVIVAPRRMGKTSLMMELIRQLKEEGYFTCNIDVFSSSNISSLAHRITESVFANNKLDKYFRLAVTNIADAFKNIKFKSEIEDYSFILEFNSKAKNAPFDLLEDSLNLIDSYAAKNKKKMLAAFDEFGDIKKLDGKHIVKLFRSVIQLQRNTTFLFSGSYESVMSELFVSRNAPFYRMTRIIELGNINDQDFKIYLTRVFAENKIVINSHRISKILSFTKGHPYYTQLYAQELLINHKLSDTEVLASHEEILQQLLIVEKSFLEKNWEDVSKKRENKVVITAIAKGVVNIYSEIDNKKVNIARAVNDLKKQGLISTRDSSFVLNDPLFNEWIIRYVS